MIMTPSDFWAIFALIVMCFVFVIIDDKIGG